VEFISPISITTTPGQTMCHHCHVLGYNFKAKSHHSGNCPDPTNNWSKRSVSPNGYPESRHCSHCDQEQWSGWQEQEGFWQAYCTICAKWSDTGDHPANKEPFAEAFSYPPDLDELPWWQAYRVTGKPKRTPPVGEPQGVKPRPPLPAYRSERK
jgi:hypothetical protein